MLILMILPNISYNARLTHNKLLVDTQRSAIIKYEHVTLFRYNISDHINIKISIIFFLSKVKKIIIFI